MDMAVTQDLVIDIHMHVVSNGDSKTAERVLASKEQGGKARARIGITAFLKWLTR
jgi:hypothetical protein